MELKKIRDTLINVVILFFIMFVAFCVRIKFLNFQSGDYVNFLSGWYDFIKLHGGFRALKYNFADYTPPYLYILTIGTYLNISKLHYIKYLTFAFELFAALFILLIVQKRYKNNKIAYVAFGCVLFIPTVIFNGVIWAQCDIIYTSFCLGSIYFIMCNKQIKSLIFYGIAISIKLQAIFIMPLFGVLLFKRRIKFMHLFIIPLTYIVLIVPSLLIGRPFKDLLLIYCHQTSEYKLMTMNAPNIYQWYVEKMGISEQSVIKYGILLGIVVVSVIVLLSIRYIKNITDDVIVELSLLFAIVAPFLLPKMHQRYFFLADVLSLLYAFYFPKRYYLAIFVPIISMFSYYPFLFNKVLVPQPILALMMLIFVCRVIYYFAERIYLNSKITNDFTDNKLN